MFTFISFWRTAAVVLCDMSSTVYYIGAIVESAIGKAAPWFILAVLLFSYAMRAVYIESCALFVRGGVYRVVKEAMGGFLAKLAVSALLFDYVLTGPISGVSAGQYIVGLVLETAGSTARLSRSMNRSRQAIKSWGSVADRLRRHALLLAPEPARHPRVERQGAQDHDRHDRHGRHHAGLVRRDARRCTARSIQLPTLASPTCSKKVEVDAERQDRSANRSRSPASRKIRSASLGHLPSNRRAAAQSARIG